MSKLAELIRRITRIEAAPIGFGAAQRKAPPTMLLVAVLGERWAQSSDAVAAGVDVLLFAGRPSEKDLAQAVAAAQGRPCGLLTPQADAEGLSRLREAGLDFLVLEPQSSASILQDEDLGFVLHLKGELTDTQLRALDALPLDAVSLEPEPAPLTIHRQMELQRISGLARRPLLLPVRPDADPQELLPLRAAAVALIALDIKERNAIDGLRRLRAAIDALPARRRLRRDEPLEVTLPRASAGEADDEDEDEE